MADCDSLDNVPPLLPLGNSAASTPSSSGFSAVNIAVGVGAAAIGACLRSFLRIPRHLDSPSLRSFVCVCGVILCLSVFAEVAGAAVSAVYSSGVHAMGTTVGTAASLTTRAVGGVLALGTRAVAGDGAAAAVHYASETVGATAGATAASSITATGAVVGAVAAVGTSIVARNAASIVKMGGRVVGAVQPPVPPQSGATGRDAVPAGAEKLVMIERGTWVVVDTHDDLSAPEVVPAEPSVMERLAALSITADEAAVHVDPGVAVPTHPPSHAPVGVAGNSGSGSGSGSSAHQHHDHHTRRVAVPVPVPGRIAAPSSKAVACPAPVHRY